MSRQLHPLLKETLKAHGGYNRWAKYKGIASTIRTGGMLWELKGAPWSRCRDARRANSTVSGPRLLPLANRIGQ